MLICLIALTSSCAVQQFPVNTIAKPFEYGGRVFGEKTKGKECIKGYDFFVVDINLSKTNTKALADKINASSYTIETKRSFLAQLLYYVTYGFVDYKTVKVIKRAS